ncbi:MAG: hypothetical protein JST85_00425 [Acidobacteria bacterium]|nr:hypothetical protein [Acidobacteriota bacterium]
MSPVEVWLEITGADYTERFTFWVAGNPPHQKMKLIHCVAKFRGKSQQARRHYLPVTIYPAP